MTKGTRSAGIALVVFAIAFGGCKDNSKPVDNCKAELDQAKRDLAAAQADLKRITGERDAGAAAIKALNDTLLIKWYSNDESDWNGFALKGVKCDGQHVMQTALMKFMDVWDNNFQNLNIGSGIQVIKPGQHRKYSCDKVP